MYNYQQLNLKKQTKDTSRTGTESQIWRSFGGLTGRREKEGVGEKVQGLRSKIDRYKIDGMLGIV